MYEIDLENLTLRMRHDVGFFSICTINLRAVIGESTQRKLFFNIDTKNQWTNYKDSDEDVYGKFFKKQNTSFEIFNDIFSSSSDEDQFSDYKLINYNYVVPFVKKYFSLSDEVLKIKDLLIQKYNINTKDTISVLYRGNDKCKETNLPTYQEMDIKLRSLVNIYPNSKIIIQSDEQDFYDYMLKYENVVVFDEIERIYKNNDNPIQHFIPKGKKVLNAQTFLAILSIISDSRNVVLNSGNVGMWVCLFRGNANDVHQYLNPKKPFDYYWY